MVWLSVPVIVSVSDGRIEVRRTKTTKSLNHNKLHAQKLAKYNSRYLKKPHTYSEGFEQENIYSG